MSLMKVKRASEGNNTVLVCRWAVTHTVPDCSDCNGWHGSCGRLFWGMFQRHLRGQTWALEIWSPSFHCLIKTHTCRNKSLVMEKPRTCLKNSQYSWLRPLQPQCKEVAKTAAQDSVVLSDFTDLPLEIIFMQAGINTDSCIFTEYLL